MKNTKLRFIVFLLVFSMVAVACGGSNDTTESPDTTEATVEETLASPATTAPPPEVIVVWAEELVANALDPLVGAYEAAAGVDVEVVVYDFGAIRTDVQTAGPAGEGPDVFLGAHDWVGEVFRCILCIQTGSWPERDSADAEETEKLLMRTSQKGNTDDVI